MKVYRFVILDPDPEVPEFACLARDDAEAERKVAAAGFTAWSLQDVRALRSSETEHAADRRLLDHPFIGPEWTGLVAAISEVTGSLTPGTFWQLTTYAAAHGYDPSESPYVQAMLEMDGSLHVEVSGTPVSGGVRSAAFDALALLGWVVPADADDDTIGSLPNAYRLFEQPWTARVVIEVFLEAITMVYGVTTADFFSLGEQHADVLESTAGLRRVGDGIVALDHANPAADAVTVVDDDRPVPIDDGDLLTEEPMTAQEILAALSDGDVVDSVGVPLFSADARNPVRRQGVKYGRSVHTDDLALAWQVDVSSWDEPGVLNWVEHIAQAGGTMPRVLVCGVNWVVSISRPEDEVEFPHGLGTRVTAMIGGRVYWDDGANDPEPIDLAATAVRDLRSKAEIAGAEITRLRHTPEELADLDPYLVESLEDDTFDRFAVRFPGGPVTVHVLVDRYRAERAAEMLDVYLSIPPDSITIAADGWAACLQASSPSLLAGGAERIASLFAARWSSEPLPCIREAPVDLDLDRWGPQSSQMAAFIVYVSRHWFSVPYEQWDDATAEAFRRVALQLKDAGRYDGWEQSAEMMRRVSSSDFFNHAGAEALLGLAGRDLIDPADYSRFTSQWRRRIGPVHPADAPIAT